jgi:hypothetical protein
MNVEVKEATQFHFWEHIIRFLFAVRHSNTNTPTSIPALPHFHQSSPSSLPSLRGYILFGYGIREGVDDKSPCKKNPFLNTLLVPQLSPYEVQVTMVLYRYRIDTKVRYSQSEVKNDQADWCKKQIETSWLRRVDGDQGMSTNFQVKPDKKTSKKVKLD